MDDEKKLENLKKEYSSLRKQYNLPEFKDLNQVFHVEKAADSITDIPLREVRRYVADKIVNYMRFVENLLNPVNVPMFIYSIVKMIDSKDKETLSQIYKDLVKLQLKLVKLDLEFDEKKEADFIKESYKLWSKVSKDFFKIIDKVDKKADSKSEVGNKGYFG